MDSMKQTNLKQSAVAFFLFLIAVCWPAVAHADNHLSGEPSRTVSEATSLSHEQTDMLTAELDCPDCQEIQQTARETLNGIAQLSASVSGIEQQLRDTAAEQANVDDAIQELEKQLQRQEGVGASSTDTVTGIVTSAYDNGQGEVVVTEQRPGEAPREINRYPRRSTQPIKDALDQRRMEKDQLETIENNLVLEKQGLAQNIQKAQTQFDNLLAQLPGCIEACQQAKAEEAARQQIAEATEQAAEAVEQAVVTSTAIVDQAVEETTGSVADAPSPGPSMDELREKAASQHDLQLDRTLTLQTYELVGDKDANGNFVDPTGTFFNGEALSPGFIKALLLVRQVLVLEMSRWIDRLNGYLRMTDAQKIEMATALRTQAAALKEAYVDMNVAEIYATRPYHPRTGRPHSWEDTYNDLMRDADFYEQRGATEKAQELRDQANSNAWGVYLKQRAAFLAMLEQANPLLGIQYDGYFGNSYLFESLREDNLSMLSSDDRNEKLLEHFNDFLAFERDRITAQRDEIRDETEVEELIELADGKYYRIHEIAAKQGLYLGADYAGLLIGEMQAVQDALVIQNQFWDGVKDGTIGVLATASWLIPVAGPFISGGFAAVQVYRDGETMVVRYLEADEAREMANVTGHVYTATADDLARAARGEFVFTLVTSVGEIAGLRSIRYVKKGAGGADEVMEVAVAAGRTGDNVVADAAGVAVRAGDDAIAVADDAARTLGGLPQSEVDFWLQTVDEANRTGLLQTELTQLDEVVKRYQQAGLPDEKINGVLQRARGEGRLDKDLVEQIDSELTIARANHEGLVVAVNPSDGMAYLKFIGGEPPNQMMRIDLTLVADIRAKAALEAAGKPQLWTQAELDLINNTILPAGDDALKWMGFNPMERFFNPKTNMMEADAVDTGLTQLFSQENLDDINRMMAQGGPSRIDPISPPGSGPASIDTDAPTWRGSGTGQSDSAAAAAAPEPFPKTEQFGTGQVHGIDSEGSTIVNRAGRESGTGTWGSTRGGAPKGWGSPGGGRTLASLILDDMVLVKAKMQSRGGTPNWSSEELLRLQELNDVPFNFRSAYGHQLTDAEAETLRQAAARSLQTPVFRLEMPAPAAGAASGGTGASSSLGSAVPAVGLTGGALAFGAAPAEASEPKLSAHQVADAMLIAGATPQEIGLAMGSYFSGIQTVAPPYMIAANETEAILKRWNFSPQAITEGVNAAIEEGGGRFSDANAILRDTAPRIGATLGDVNFQLALNYAEPAADVIEAEPEPVRIGADFKFGDGFKLNAGYRWAGWNDEPSRDDLRLDTNPFSDSDLSGAYLQDHKPSYVTGFEVSIGYKQPMPGLTMRGFFADDADPPPDQGLQLKFPMALYGLKFREIGEHILENGGTPIEAAEAIGAAYEEFLLWEEEDDPPPSMGIDNVFLQASGDVLKILLDHREQRNIDLQTAAYAMLGLAYAYGGTVGDADRALNMLYENWPGITPEERDRVNTNAQFVIGLSLVGNPVAMDHAFNPKKGMDNIPLRARATIDPLWVIDNNVRLDQASAYPNDPLYPKNGQWNQGGSALRKGIGGILKMFDAPLVVDGTLASDQWGLPAIGLTPKDNPQSAWNIVDGSEKNTIVAVIDSGFDMDLEDGPRFVWTNVDEIPDNGIDDDANGYVDDVHGWNFVAETNDFDDDFGHGTFVSGIIAAKTNNGVGMAGINPGAQIMPLKVLDIKGKGHSLSVYRAIRYAVDNGARVLNLSLAGKGLSKLEQIAINYAYSMGSIVVVAAGNSSRDVAAYGPPGAHRTFSVASLDMDGKKRKSSNWGQNIALAAPGESIYSLAAKVPETAGRLLPMINRGYARLNGTSYAAPFAAGVASLIWAKDPSLTNRQVEDLMLQTARDILDPGWDAQSGEGLLNAYGALSHDAGALLAPRITEVVVNKKKRKVASVDVYGVVRGDLKHYTVEVGRGKKPKEWQTAYGPASKPVDHGLICRLPADFFKKGSKWTLRLTAISTAGVSKTRSILVSKK